MGLSSSRRNDGGEEEMTVTEFIEWLKTQDQEAIVLCLAHESSNSYYEQGGICSEKEFIPDYSNYTDFRGNKNVKPDATYFNKRYLLIGDQQ